MTDRSLVLESALVRLPAELLAQTCRSQHKSIEKELSSVLAALAQLGDHEASASTGDGGGIAPEAVEKLVQKVRLLKRKIDDCQKLEDQGVHRCRARCTLHSPLCGWDTHERFGSAPHGLPTIGFIRSTVTLP